MKRITLAFLMLFCITTFAQQGVNYKAVIKDGAGVIVANTLIQVQFIILDGATNVYEETHAPITDANGIAIMNIGEGTPVMGSTNFITIDWSSSNHFLNVQIDTGGGYQDMGTTAFKTVPYALYAATAGSVTETQTLANVVALGNSANSQLKNVTDPTDAQDSATKAYVDTLIATLEAEISAFHPPAAIGDIRAGGVVFWVDPVDNRRGLVCAMSDYVDAREWGCFGTDLPSVPNVTGFPPNGSGAEIGDGINNTNNILTDCPTAPAALAARSFGAEWFLPSAKELNQMYVNKAVLEAVPGFSPFQNIYWCSTENSNNLAWRQFFSDGSGLADSKNFGSIVRAVRAF